VRNFRIIAHIGGTLLDPRLDLSSDERIALSYTEILSYLVFGQPSLLGSSDITNNNALRPVAQALLPSARRADRARAPARASTSAASTSSWPSWSGGGAGPPRPPGRPSRERVRRLHAAVRESLLQGIANRGSSVDDYVDLYGARGRQQEELQVYGRGGRPCFKCGAPLTLVRLGGRATVFCRRCQR